MTQVPGPSQRPVDAPVVPGGASTPDSPAPVGAAPAIDRESALYDRLWDLIDDRLPERDVVRSDVAATIADAVFADMELLDALVAYQQQRRVITDHAALDALPVGSVVMDSPYPEGNVHQRTSDGFWTEPGFDGMFTTQVLSLPAVVLWTPPDITERPAE